MKKIACIFSAFMLIALSMSGCSDNNSYVVPEGNCIVSVPENFFLGAPANSQTECEKIESQIKGVSKIEGRDYYSVTKGAPLDIVRNFSWYDYDKAGYFGSGKVVSGYTIGEENIAFKLYDVDFTFTCNNNCDIEPIYENFTTVGQIYLAMSEEETFRVEYLHEAKNFFNDDGSVKQLKNLYYLFLNSEFTTYQDCWNTNLVIKDYEYAFRENNSIVAKFTADAVSHKIAMCSVCRYESGGYFISYVTEGNILGTITMDIGENELNITFS